MQHIKCLMQARPGEPSQKDFKHIRNRDCHGENAVQKRRWWLCREMSHIAMRLDRWVYLKPNWEENTPNLDVHRTKQIQNAIGWPMADEQRGRACSDLEKKEERITTILSLISRMDFRYPAVSVFYPTIAMLEVLNDATCIDIWQQNISWQRVKTWQQ